MPGLYGLLCLMPCVLGAPSVIRVIQTSKAGDRFVRLADVPFQRPGKSAPVNTTILIDPTETFQSILGFGGAFTEAAGYNLQRMSPQVQQQIVDAYFGSPDTSLGYSLCRVHMNSCDFSLASYSHDDTPDDFDLKDFNIDHDYRYLIPFVRAAKQVSTRVLNLFFSPWSPPAWMKGNGQMTGSSKPGLKNDPRVYGAWAKFFSLYADKWKAEGLPFWGVTVQNEPLFAAPWEACCYSINDMAAFIKNYLGPVLQKDHPELTLMAYDHNRDQVQDWAAGIMKDPDVAQYVQGTAFHWYTDSNTPTLNMFENLDTAHQAAPSKFLLATEACYCPGVKLGDWTRGEAYGIDILNDLLHYSVGWVDWNLVLDDQGGPNHLGNMCDAPIIVQPTQGTFVKQPSYFFMGHFSKFVEPKSVRTGLSLSSHQVCRWRLSASYQGLCDGITWACANQQCSPGTDSCAPEVIYDNADAVYDQWYQSHKSQGPSACDFSGTAVLEGIQVVSFLRPDSQVVAVVLNVGDREAFYNIQTEGQQAFTSVGPHSVQSLMWNR